jgi:hypothetical protein
MRDFIKLISIFLSIVLGVASVAFACAFSASHRAYLDRRFWQPFRYLLSQTARELRPHEPEVWSFAGYAKKGHPSLEAARQAYRKLPFACDNVPLGEPCYIDPFLQSARQAIENAQREVGLTPVEQDELDLLSIKVDRTQGETGDCVCLEKARDRLRLFVRQARTSEYRSEARGWLARVHYLLGDYSSAAKIYLDEFQASDSNFDSESLQNSLQIIFAPEKGQKTLAAHIDEYFDTPEHAVFAIKRISNPIYEGRDPKIMRQTGNAVLEQIEKHRQLFTVGKASEELALAMMRVSLFMGDTSRVLQYSKRIPTNSKTSKRADYNWMLASALFLRREFAAAEPPLRQMLKAPDVNLLRKGKAAMALVGVYYKLNRPQEQLHAALQLDQIRRREDALWRSNKRELPLDEPINSLNIFMPFTDLAFDLPYQLDTQLPIAELQKYLDHHPQCPSVVPYSLAVRYARIEEYGKAAELFARVGAKKRHRRMLDAQQLYAAMSDAGQSAEVRLQARFDYASFLARNSCHIFFNDRLWDRFQTSVFLNDDAKSALDSKYYVVIGEWQCPGMTRREREEALKRERGLQDDQEEYWRAYKIFDSIVQETGYSPLGRQAARSAINSLSQINERFGRRKEIRAETIRLIAWLKSHRAS